MLPPSPQHAQAQYSAQPPHTRGPPPPPPFSLSGREYSAMSATPRPGSSMSISSMLGSDADRPARDSILGSQGHGMSAMIAASATSPAIRSMPAPSPPQRSFGNGSLSRRSHTPDDRRSTNGQNTRPFRAYSGGPTQRPFSGVQGSSPEGFRFGPPLRNHNNLLFTAPIERDQRKSQDRRSSIDAMTEQVTSQQSGYRTPPTETENEASRHAALVRDDESYSQSSSRSPGLFYSARDPNHDVGSLRNNDEHIMQHGSDERGIPTPSQERICQAPDFSNSRRKTMNGVGGPNYPFLSRPSHQTVSSPRERRNDVKSLGDQTPEPHIDVTSSSGQSSNIIEAQHRLRDARSSGLVFPQQDSQQSRLLDISESRHVQQSPQESTSMTPEENFSAVSRMVQHFRPMEEAQQQPKTSLGLVVDNSRRGGRNSPLPQAVQGAQGQMRGPASEPGIKNEFGKMFSGIGSGVGSVTPTPGLVEPRAATSFPSSPIRAEEVGRRTPFSTRVDLFEVTKPRVISRAGRRTKKVKEEELKQDGENVDGQVASTLARTRGTKRSRHGHHHHQHQHNHQ